MDNVSALVIGVAKYESLDGWSIAEDRTVADAIAVTKSLRKRGVPAEKIKLFLSQQGPVPPVVMDVRAEPARREAISDFIVGDFKRPAFASASFFFFCSGHGFIVGTEPCLILADSKPAIGSLATYRCVGLDRFRTQLLGMGFSRQLLCINACQVPAEWSPPGQASFVDTAPDMRLPGIQQVRFLAAPEMQTAPVESRGDGLSNGFAVAVRDCIDAYHWPPDPGDWDALLRQNWGNLTTLGLYGVGQVKFKILREQILKIDRKKQFDFATDALKLARNGGTQRDQVVDDMVRETLIDLHAIDSDLLTLLISRLESELFKNDRMISGGLGRATWPAPGLTNLERRAALIQSLAYALVDDESLDNANDIAAALAAMGNCVRVVFLEINRSTADDKDLVHELITLWQAIIARVVAFKSRMSTLPLLIVGHINPDPAAGAEAIDTARYYHDPTPFPEAKHRLREVRWQELKQWLDDVLPSDKHPGRSDLDAEIAKELGGKLIEFVQPIRMAQIVDAITRRAG